MSTIESILSTVQIPDVVKIRQSLPRPLLEPTKLTRTLSDREIGTIVRPGESIAVAVGSRGIADQSDVVSQLVDSLHAAGADPFIVPAMGSHGGATAKGQEDLLVDMGISEATVGAPVRSSMAVDQIGTASGLPVMVDRLAWGADGIIIVNRIKPHSSFRGKRESGLAKMIAIGLGKQAGAQACHRQGMPEMANSVAIIAKQVLSTGRIRAGVALVENAYHELCYVELIPGAEIFEREPALLEISRDLQPTLPFDDLDVLIVDMVGKNIAGTGLDCNVVGRYSSTAMSGGPSISRIAALQLTPETHGNANGIGLLDVTTRRVYDRMTFEETYPNALTSTAAVSVRIPMVMANDMLAIRAAIQTSGAINPAEVRLVRIKDTLSLGDLQASPAAAAQLSSSADAKIIGTSEPLAFDDAGNLLELSTD